MKKTFDCVQMKREAAARIYEQIAGMSLEEELRFWQEKAQQYRAVPPKSTRTRAASRKVTKGSLTKKPAMPNETPTPTKAIP